MQYTHVKKKLRDGYTKKKKKVPRTGKYTCTIAIYVALTPLQYTASEILSDTRRGMTCIQLSHYQREHPISIQALMAT